MRYPATCRAASACRALAVLALVLVTGPAVAQTQDVRIMAANLTTTGQVYPNPGPGARIMDGLNPDIVCINEWKLASGTFREFVDDVFGASFDFYVEPSGNIPNGVISRWPILESGEWDDVTLIDRDFVYARIDIPGSIDLWAVSVHLKAGSSGSDSSQRAGQATALVNFINANIPSGDYVVIAGDLNTQSRVETSVDNLAALVDTGSPWPVDNFGNDDTNEPRNKPYDWVLADDELDPLATATVIGTNTFPSGVVFDSSVYTPLSEVAPVQFGDSHADGIQHMAVMRTFAVPASTDPDDYGVSGNTIDFATVNAENAPFIDRSIFINVTDPVTITNVDIFGSGAAEFSLLTPGTGLLDADTTMTFQWDPSGNDGVTRTVTATIETDGQPAQFQITLSGETKPPPPSGSSTIDIGGYKVGQTNRGTVVTIPGGTVLEDGDLLVIGRQASKSEFEGYWSTTLGPNVTYLVGLDLPGSEASGFPIINGGGTFNVLDAGDVQIDPAGGGSVPNPGVGDDDNFKRDDTATTDFTQADYTTADPGVFTGITHDSGALVISEISDADNVLGPDAFHKEFVELYFDGGGEPVDPPPTPGNLTALAGESSITLDWDAVTAPNLEGYLIYRSTSQGFDHRQITPSPIAGTTTFEDGDVVAGVTYYYRVTALVTGPAESGVSNEASAGLELPEPNAARRAWHWLQ